MAIAPIVGKLRKRLITDISAGLGLGFAGGYLFWWVYFVLMWKGDGEEQQLIDRYTVHIPMMAKRKAFYDKLGVETTI